MMDKKVVISNVCFIKDEINNKVLLLKRDRDPMRGLWTGVGGKTEFGEAVYDSCVREVKEETNLDVDDLRLRAVITTRLQGQQSSWLLFIYVTNNYKGVLGACDEGFLQWVSYDELKNYELIGFIKSIIPCILADDKFVEGILEHDLCGNVVNKKLHESKLFGQ